MSKKLLLADDSITIQKVIGITFASEDYELSVVDNGDAGFEKAGQIRPDLILADVFMPGKNGYELCAAIKKDPALSHIPVLLLTGTFEPFDENKAKAAGADSWIAKPFESQTLIDRVEGLLNQPVVAAAPAAVKPAVSSPPAAPVPPAPVQTASVAPRAVATPTAPPAPAPVEDDFWGDETVVAAAPAAQPAAPAPPSPVQAPLAPTVVIASPAPPVPAPTPVEDDFWGGETVVAAAPGPPATPAAGEWQADAGDDLWGGIALGEESAVAITEKDSFVAPITDDWGDLATEVSVVAIQPASPQVAPAPLYATPPTAMEPPAVAGSGWDDEILALDEVDILEEEDILETPNLDSFAETSAISIPEDDFLIDPFAEEEAVPAAVGSVWDAAPQPAAASAVAVAPALNDMAAAPAIPDTAWDLTDDEPSGSEQVWGTSVEVKEEVLLPAPAAAITPAPTPKPVVPAATVAPVSAPVPLSTTTVEAHVAALGDEDIARIVEKLAGAVIERLAQPILEKIVWEVVPDLAEAMIRDEIRAIKESVK